MSLADECSYVTELCTSTLCLQASLHGVCQDLSSNELHGQVFGEKCTTWDIKVTPHACKHSLCLVDKYQSHAIIIVASQHSLSNTVLVKSQVSFYTGDNTA